VSSKFNARVCGPSKHQPLWPLSLCVLSNATCLWPLKPL
jgi:hypothetical protein